MVRPAAAPPTRAADRAPAPPAPADGSGLPAQLRMRIAAARTAAGGSVQLLDAGQQPVAGTVHRPGQIPDLVQPLVFAVDLQIAGEPDAGPILSGRRLDPQQTRGQVD